MMNKITLSVSLDFFNHGGELNVEDAIFYLPPKGYHKDHEKESLVYWEVIKQDDTTLIVEFNKAEWSAKGLRKWSYLYKVQYNKKGELIWREEDHSPVWLENLKNRRNLVKNPTNEHMHNFITNGDPLYESENFYITCQRDLYVRVDHGFWVPIADGVDWIKDNYKYVPYEYLQEIKRYLLMRKMAK